LEIPDDYFYFHYRSVEHEAPNSSTEGIRGQ